MTRPAKPYSEVESAWIKEEIRKRNIDDPEDKDFVDTLVYFEKMILTGPTGWASGYQWGIARNKHPAIYEKLLKELKPEQYQKLKERQQVEAEQREIQTEHEETREKRLEAQARREWMEMNKQNSCL